MATYQEQIERNRLKAEMRKRKDAEDAAKKLTPEQIKNWRMVLAQMGIPFAMSIPEEMVNAFKDGIQQRLEHEAQRVDAAHGEGEKK